MDRVYGLIEKKTEEGMKLVCKSCGEYAGLICMFTASSKEWTRHYCRCKGCGRYISVTRRNEVLCESEETGEKREMVGR